MISDGVRGGSEAPLSISPKLLTNPPSQRGSNLLSFVVYFIAVSWLLTFSSYLSMAFTLELWNLVPCVTTTDMLEALKRKHNHRRPAKFLANGLI